MGKLSPMMQQYMEIKEQNKDSILMYRLGDFYEMFFDDAKICSEELELVLTGRDCGLEERAPMCGVPYHSCESYIARLIGKGFKVAICEQTEDPATAKGIVKREVVRVITPGTVIEDAMLEEGKNNYLASVYIRGNECGLSFIDASTGSVSVTAINGDGLESRLISELGRFSPSEILISESHKIYPNLVTFLKDGVACRVSECSDAAFEKSKKGELIIKQFKVLSVEELDLTIDSVQTASLDFALNYLIENGMDKLSSVEKINHYSSSVFMSLDISSVRNLELLETMRGKAKRGSLLWVLDKTKTAMGKRLLRSWLIQPLLSPTEIIARHNAVDEIFGDTVLRGEMTEYMTGIFDIERLMTRVVYGVANPKELQCLARTISRFAPLKQLLQTANCKVLKQIESDIDVLTDVAERIEATICDEPPTSMKDGKIIREGFNSDVDTLRQDLTGGKQYITEIEANEKEKTGIKALKVRYNKVFGYYIEVPAQYNDIVPEEYIRKQTLANAERYITDELKALEARVLGASERVVKLEFELFCELRNFVASHLERLQRTASAIAKLDVLCSFATVSAANRYCRPQVTNDGRLSIIGGRHPVVEVVSKNPFVANDTILDTNDNRCAIITGPNMAGKSTYMRQVALITIMSQIGCFVPAESATLGIVDAVFTRVGASDDLATGQSTFMVEMSEVAHILQNATCNSLLVLDEIGRGTSTFDGMSIARAVLEFVADRKKLGAKSLFATHYHELTALENQLSGVKNYNIAVKKHGDDITFLRRIVRGGADDSYGIEVAKLAGLPNSVINRAKAVLKEIESEGVVREVSKPTVDSLQLPLGVGEYNDVIEELKNIDVNVLTPIETMSVLSEIVKRVKNI
ncbi:MAG: DNA mismatch repair protein MutS [Ruminococcaceae bacterium]|nr:DNA mismatch repair protein MutS [Oscillospiraceae bacterium]